VTQIDYESTPPEFAMPCPACGYHVPGQSALQTLYKCPSCDSEFIVPLGQPAPQRPDRADELSGLRIRNVSVLRRATYRTRSHFIIGAAASFMAVVEMALLLVRSIRYRIWYSGFAAACVGVALAILCWHCIKRAMDLTRELRDSKLQLPDEPQDFSNLSDGSHRVRDLENLVGGDSQPPA